MPRKKLTQYTITSNDRAFYTVLAKSGKVNEELAQKYFKIISSRLRIMEKNGFLEKQPIVINGKAEKCYVLSDYGARWAKKNLPNVNKLAKPARQGTTHDLHLFEELAKLPREQQEMALTEYDILACYGKREHASPPDLFIPYFIKPDGEESQAMAIEVITRTYKKINIIQKEIFCKHVLNLRKEDITYVKAI